MPTPESTPPPLPFVHALADVVVEEPIVCSVYIGHSGAVWIRLSDTSLEDLSPDKLDPFQVEALMRLLAKTSVFAARMKDGKERAEAKLADLQGEMISLRERNEELVAKVEEYERALKNRGVQDDWGLPSMYDPDSPPEQLISVVPAEAEAMATEVVLRGRQGYVAQSVTSMANSTCMFVFQKSERLSEGSLLTAAEAEAKGYTVDRHCTPWVAYAGPRFAPTEIFPVRVS